MKHITINSLFIRGLIPIETTPVLRSLSNLKLELNQIYFLWCDFDGYAETMVSRERREGSHISPPYIRQTQGSEVEISRRGGLPKGPTFWIHQDPGDPGHMGSGPKDLEQVERFKYLRIELDPKLSFLHHVSRCIFIFLYGTSEQSKMEITQPNCY